MIRCIAALFLIAFPNLVRADEPAVRDIRAFHRSGQTFVTWKDVATGDDGAKFRYSLYRFERPITADNLKDAELCYDGILDNSGRLFGGEFNRKDRSNGEKPYAILEEGGKPLPPWSGLAVRTAVKNGSSYYAVIATDEKLKPVSRVVPGQSATTEAVEETVAPIQPIKLYDSKSRGIYSPQTSITGLKGLPLRVELHASQGQGGGAGDYGDYYLYFATSAMGYRDGLPGVFSIEEQREKIGNYLNLRVRETIEHPNGKNAMETYWFGYLCVPQHATHKEPRAYPFTERREEWIIDWIADRYGVDREHVTAGGGSMGAWGSTTYAFRHPERFAVVYPNRPRSENKKDLPSLLSAPIRNKSAPMDDGKTDYFVRMDMVKYAADHHEDLPFFAFCCGRRDGFATWQEQIDMVKALTASHHGFAFAWNDGDHGTGAEPMKHVTKHYSPEKFARNRSYPAFGNSSLDQKLGNGDPKDGDLEGGINLGFAWKNVVDEADRWEATLTNDLAKSEMTVDVTPRRCQKFRVQPKQRLGWTSSTGQAGLAFGDEHGRVTVPAVVLQAGKETTLKIMATDR